MGWIFRKRIKILPGVYLNVSKKGLGVRVGVRGAGVSTGPGGTYVSGSPLPGSGIYFKDKIAGTRKARRALTQLVGELQEAQKQLEHGHREGQKGLQQLARAIHLKADCPKCGRSIAIDSTPIAVAAIKQADPRPTSLSVLKTLYPEHFDTTHFEVNCACGHHEQVEIATYVPQVLAVISPVFESGGETQKSG